MSESKEIEHSRMEGFEDTLKNILKLNIEKNKDYAAADDAYFNFEFTAYILERAVQKKVPARYLPYIALIGTKLARLINLLGRPGEARNESVEDTFDDMATYVVIAKCDFLRTIRGIFKESSKS